jgi:hypothetical protein
MSATRRIYFSLFEVRTYTDAWNRKVAIFSWYYLTLWIAAAAQGLKQRRTRRREPAGSDPAAAVSRRVDFPPTPCRG